jgi:hypothetical protein
MKTPSNLDPSLVRDLTSTRKKLTDLPALIKSDDEQAKIGAHQKAVHLLIKSIEAWYEKSIRPIADALKALRDEKKLVLAEPIEWEESAEDLLSAYYAKKEIEASHERERLQRQLDKEAEAARKLEVKALRADGDKEAARELSLAPVIAPIAEVANTAALDGRSFRTDLDVTVLDIDLVPLEYVTRTLRLAEVKAAYKSGVRDIPGLLVKEIKTLVNR